MFEINATAAIKRGTDVWTVWFRDGLHFDYNAVRAEWCLWPWVA